MDDFFHDFRVAMQDYNGYALAATLTPEPPADNAGRLYSFHRGATKYTIRSVLAQEFLTNEHLSEEEVRAWVDLYESYYNAVGELLATEEAANSGRAMDAPWINVFEAWKEVVNQLIRGYKANCFPSWSIPCLYVVADYLSKFAILADEQVKGDESNMMFTSGYDDEIMGDADENYCLQEAARQINLIFSTAISDRNPLEDSRKWATYHIANILFSVHFRLNTMNLAKNLLKAVTTTPDLPPLSAFPKSDQVTFNYYTGILHFVDEEFDKAEDRFLEAWKMCDKRSVKHCEIILSHLIPCHIMTKTEVPSKALLAMFPRLEQLFGPLISAIKRADLVGFDAALEGGYRGLVKRRIYLAVLLFRSIVERNIFRHVALLQRSESTQPLPASRGLQIRSRIPLAEFVTAYRMSSQDASIDESEVECRISNLIHKGLIKGYISREHKIVVLNKNGAFPGTGV